MGREFESTAENRQDCPPQVNNGLPRSEEPHSYDFRILQSLRRINRSVEVYSKRLSSHYKITGPQLICLLTIAEQSPITASQIAKEIHLSPSTVVGVLDRLEEKLLIERRRDKKDRRKVYLSLSKNGTAMAKQAPSPLLGKLAGDLIALSELEQSTIALSLERIVELMETHQSDPSPPNENGTTVRSGNSFS
jgi:DNA-binding MarR family transcriptional regulator